MDGRPSKKTVEAMKIALGVVADKGNDTENALKLWNDFRWAMKTMDGDWTKLQALILEYVGKAEQGLKTPEIRDAVIQRFKEMHARVTEFTVEDEGEQPTP